MGSSEAGLVVVLLVAVLYVNACMALDCVLNSGYLDPDRVAYTINVDVRGTANFTKVQQAIDVIPSGNTRWIRIFIFEGTYTEKVEIPKDKGCIYIQGMRSDPVRHPIISWGDHNSTDTSPTFTAYSDNIVLNGLAFENTYALASERKGPLKPGVAARLVGDKYAVISCSFIGLQDTLWDAQGKHYFKNSYISGVVDFVWGSGQSIFEECTLDVTLGAMKDEKAVGYITAQGRESESDANGFVFKGCNITGDKTMLGRAYRPYSRVIFYQCYFPDSVLPLGWDAWDFKGQEGKLTYVEVENKGPGANTTGRVSWVKQPSRDELNKFVGLSYIDQDGWMSNLPPQALT